ncbi:sporulation kinase E [Oxobacter pfennigii]|uniref:histidine kinase n=1 Tax=Oxobacter pfennigii TaxID=36849 RepID=A0A0P8W7R0_9CLOT|nr:ATP-binding protein [Oxobacter pfennigii]KPU44081.1 sporulation kinase E [Oxobacter pfennigii]
MKELSLHILDIAQNSITAGASAIVITIIEDIPQDKLIIIIEDNGYGIEKENIEKVKESFYTTKKGKSAGLGIPLFMEAAKRCSGDLYIESAKGEGTKVTAHFSHSHINRAPLGSVWDTIASLVVCNENIDFIYTHIYNGSVFEFNTIDIRKLLGEVSITSPKAGVWVKEYLKENIKVLYGGVEN